MSVWLIDPHDPLIFRDGKPFDATPGASAQSLPFPFPSTIAGGIRSLAGLNEQNQFIIPKAELANLKRLKVKGPILVELTRDGQDIAPDRWLVPAPGDAMMLKTAETKQGQKQCQFSQMLPRTFSKEFQTDMQSHPSLLFVAQTKEYKKQKPSPDAPKYWFWHHFETWLNTPHIYEEKIIAANELGLTGPVPQVRVHVGIDPATRAGRDQFLFDTMGMEFAALIKDREHQDENEVVDPRLYLHNVRRLALAVLVDDNSSYAYKLKARLSPLGGERRLASWRPSKTNFPACPQTVKEQICKDRQCRIILLTPAYFKNGFYPESCLRTIHNVTPDLRAIKIERPQVVSGWDIANGERKSTRRLAPEGTVIFLKLNGSTNENDIQHWVEDTWMQCFTEGEGTQQEELDGFGLAVVGTWTEPSVQ